MEPVMPDNPNFAINTYSYTLSHDASSCLEHLADQGYTDFELMMYPGHLWPADADEPARRGLRRRIAEGNLRVVTLNMPNIDLNIAGASVEVREYSLAILRKVIELASDLGVTGVVIGPGKANPLFPAPKQMLMAHLFRGLELLSPLAQKCGTSLYLENMPFGFLPDAEGLMTALEEFGADEIGIVYDLANAVFIKEDLATALSRVRARLRLIHVSDTGLQVYKHDPVGRGVVPFSTIPRLLQNIGHREPPVLEIISRDADLDIRESAAALTKMGWGAPRAKD
jgi:sugar phosphate isomerase/epimerase